MSKDVIFSTDFSDGIDSQLKWLYEPKRTECVQAGDKTMGGLCVHPVRPVTPSSVLELRIVSGIMCTYGDRNGLMIYFKLSCQPCM